MKVEDVKPGVWVTCSAIRYRLKGADRSSIVTGKSHTDCLHALIASGISKSKREMDYEIQGFMVLDNRSLVLTHFATREEAYEIAKKSGQLVEENLLGILFSEFCNFVEVEERREKSFILNREPIPDDYLDDVIELSNFIYMQLDIKMSNRECYDFWNKVSDDFCASWLDTKITFPEKTRKETILELLEKVGTIVE